MTETLKTLPVIAVDGFSASGKGTLARRLAQHFDFAYLDTGLLYRASGVLAHRAGVDVEDVNAIAVFAKTLRPEDVLSILDDPELRSSLGGVLAAKVAKVPEIRANLLKFQRDFYSQPPHGKRGAVLDGRDIGTVIAPEAPVKIFMQVDVKIRAEWRWKELQKRGETVTYAQVLEDLEKRDLSDRTRAVSPLRPADDAVILDATGLNPDQVFEKGLAIARLKVC